MCGPEVRRLLRRAKETQKTMFLLWFQGKYSTENEEVNGVSKWFLYTSVGQSEKRKF